MFYQRRASVMFQFNITACRSCERRGGGSNLEFQLATLEYCVKVDLKSQKNNIFLEDKAPFHTFPIRKLIPSYNSWIRHYLERTSTILPYWKKIFTSTNRFDKILKIIIDWISNEPDFGAFNFLHVHYQS